MSTKRPGTCKNCGHASLTVDRYTPAGDVSCNRCGTVQEENPIVSEVQFGESSSGAAMVQGAMVGADQTRATFPGNRQNAMESREQTEVNGKKKIKRIATALGIPDHISDSAGEWFKLALAQNFVQGRCSQNVLATCLYVACRKEKTHHMLIDFSSRLQISVYSLGATFLKMVKALCITKLPLADPSLFIQHFAEKLDFGDQCTKVVKDAVKLAQRMSNDWIHEGRRPAGIAGACVLLAARMNNFRRTHAEIVAVAHVGSETLQRRLNEFKNTKSGQLTVHSFRESQGTEASNPPSFDKNRVLEEKIREKIRLKKTALKKYKVMAEEAKIEEAAELEELRKKAAEEEALEKAQKEKGEETQKGDGEAETETDTDTGPKKDTDKSALDIDEEPGSESETGSPQPRVIRRNRRLEDEEENDDDDEVEAAPDKSKLKSRKNPENVHNTFMDTILHTMIKESELSAQEIYEEVGRVIRMKKKSLNKAIYLTPGDSMTERASFVDVNRPRNLVKNLPRTQELLEAVSSSVELNSDDDDDIVAECELDDDEVELKTRIWTGLNHDFMVAQEKKRLKLEADELAGNTSGAPRKKRQKAAPTNLDAMGVDTALQSIGVNEQTGQPLTAAERNRHLVGKKSLSKKLNYTTLDHLFDPSKAQSIEEAKAVSSTETSV